MITRDGALGALSHDRTHSVVGTADIEGNWFDDDIVAKLVRKDHDVRTLSPVQFGAAQIVRNDCGVLSAATEPRKDGNAQGY